jgi:chromosomal replication initiation ATPase DnaA
MPFAMVPVPEEHVLAVMQFITRAVARTSGQPWDRESIAEVWNDVDDPCKAMLVHVARASLADGELDAEEVARRLGASIRETAAIVNELNSFARDGFRANLITAPVAAEQLPDGTVTEKRIFRMALEIADLVEEVAAGFVIADT